MSASHLLCWSWSGKVSIFLFVCPSELRCLTVDQMLGQTWVHGIVEGLEDQEHRGGHGRSQIQPHGSDGSPHSLKMIWTIWMIWAMPLCGGQTRHTLCLVVSEVSIEMRSTGVHVSRVSWLTSAPWLRSPPNSQKCEATHPPHPSHLCYCFIISWTEWSFAATGVFKPIGTNCRRKAVLGCPQWREARLIS